jgi:hypothetical protein
MQTSSHISSSWSGCCHLRLLWPLMVLAAAASDVAADFGIAACIGHIEITDG